MEGTEARFSIHSRDRQTGRSGASVQQNRTALDVARYFATDEMSTYVLLGWAVVNDGDGYTRTGEQFLEDNPEVAVVAAWTAGANLARRHRQGRIHDLWPNLAMALDNLAVAHEA